MTARRPVLLAVGQGAWLALGAVAPVLGQDADEPLTILSIPEMPDRMEFLDAPATFCAPVLVAEDTGCIDACGVDVTLASKSGTAETIQLLATGQSQAVLRPQILAAANAFLEADP
jgi:NitT/TauT family transport system substrate-binding protein